MIPIGVVLIVLCFYLLGSTADGYLSPALETIAVKLGISESLAGVTFLAFGNGAPDVISALSASGGDTDGIYLAIGALLGAGLFVTSIVASVVILSAKKSIHVLPKVYLRDLGFYMLGPIILTIASFYGELSIHFSVTFLVVYVIFVLVVVISDRLGKVKVGAEIDTTTVHLQEDSMRKTSETVKLLDEDSHNEVEKPEINASHYDSSKSASLVYDEKSFSVDSINHDHF